MESAIHPSAVIEDGAALGAGVQVGPFCHVGSVVRLA
ncbi:MAG: acyl-[acyl-carrier-protein]--UDP-N-acetylglucosamine O-acyltransferase, partial [Alphaproteobacteria bacterium]|nr:acyl-[acyl-carrier-protein]--UDP-N-acetylglucosamine O-acyltransferase [Alphaproteobacteria bacterium]